MEFNRACKWHLQGRKCTCQDEVDPRHVFVPEKRLRQAPLAVPDWSTSAGAGDDRGLGPCHDCGHTFLQV